MIIYFETVVLLAEYELYMTKQTVRFIYDEKAVFLFNLITTRGNMINYFTVSMVTTILTIDSLNVIISCNK